MANLSLADQLDHSIEALLADSDGESSFPDAVDSEMNELLEIAALMRLMPNPQFKANLKDDLLLQAVALQGVATNGHATNGHSTAPPPREPVRKQQIPTEILPTLLGAGQGTYPVHRSNFALSFVGHGVAVALLISSGLWMAKRDAARNHTLEGTVVDIGIYVPNSSTDPHGGGSGGDASTTPASNGSVPRLAREQFTPPTVVVHNQNPRLIMEPTLVAPPVIPLPHNNQTGNPLSSVLTTPSNGVGFDGGIGNHGGGGIGDGLGPGFGVGNGGSTGGGNYIAGRGGVSEPRVIYRPEPEYSDEARKLRVQGTVTIAAIIDTQGRPQGLRVIQPLGVGLDEKAVEAVRKWRFQPAMKDARPVAVLVNIEVSFRLY
jgi:periplasmic protein TonB